MTRSHRVAAACLTLVALTAVAPGVVDARVALTARDDGKNSAKPSSTTTSRRSLLNHNLPRGGALGGGGGPFAPYITPGSWEWSWNSGDGGGGGGGGGGGEFNLLSLFTTTSPTPAPTATSPFFDDAARTTSFDTTTTTTTTTEGAPPEETVVTSFSSASSLSDANDDVDDYEAYNLDLTARLEAAVFDIFAAFFRLFGMAFEPLWRAMSLDLGLGQGASPSTQHQSRKHIIYRAVYSHKN